MPNAKTKKIFLGGLAQGTTEEDIREYFHEVYGGSVRLEGVFVSGV